MKALAWFVFALVTLAGAHAAPAAEIVDPGAQWTAYKAHFIDADGRLFDASQENVSHSEGQGYGMLLSVFNDDRETFARMWAWTREHLDVRDDALAAWRWRPGDNPHVLDPNNATDGDLLISWALAEAGRRWGEADYDRQAARIARALARRVLFESAFGPTLAPGAAGFGAVDRDDGPVVNLSYWVFPAFDALKRVAPEVDWAGLNRSGLSLLETAQFGPRRLPADWIGLKSGAHPASGFPARFGYDALRIPLYLAWGGSRGKARLTALIGHWSESGPLSVVEVDSGLLSDRLGAKGYLAVEALAKCAAYDQKFPKHLYAVEFDSYYSSTLHMLSLTALRQRFPKC